jgi:hypothetical protein
MCGIFIRLLISAAGIYLCGGTTLLSIPQAYHRSRGNINNDKYISKNE